MTASESRREREDEVVVRRYGLLAPEDWGEDCEAELQRMTRLWNRLVEIDRGHRAAYVAATADDPVVTEIESRLAAARNRRDEAVAERRRRWRAARRRLETPELDAAAATARAEIGELRPQAKDARRAAREARRPRLQALEDDRRAAVKEARRHSGLYWPNYNAVIAAYERARKRAMREGRELRFRSHDGGGRLVCQIQGGMDADELFAGARSQVRVAPVPQAAWTSPRRGERRRLARTSLTMTVHRRGRGNRTVTWPMVMHRPLPEGARIKEVTIARRREADGWRWSASFLCRAPATEKAAAPADACGIDVGWRRTPTGLRVAVVAHGDGRLEHVHLDESAIAMDRHLDAVRSARSRSLQALLAELRPLDWTGAPPPLDDLGPAVVGAQRIGFGRAAALAHAWRERPHWHPREQAEALRWQRRDKALWQEHAGLARRLRGRRRDLYRRLAARLCHGHGVIGLPDVDWRWIGRRERPDGEANEVARRSGRSRRLAAPGELLATLRATAAREGVAVHAPAGRSSFLCHVCGEAHEPVDRAPLMHRCPHCRTLWDQDENAARVLRAAAASARVPADGRRAAPGDGSSNGATDT